MPGTSPAGTGQATGPPVAPHLPRQPCSGASTHGTILSGEGRGCCQLGMGTGGCPQPSAGAQSPHARVPGGSGHPYPRRPAGCAPSPRSAVGGDARGCVRSSTRLRREGPGAVGRDPLSQHSPIPPGPHGAKLSREGQSRVPAPHKTLRPPSRYRVSKGGARAEQGWGGDPRSAAARGWQLRAQSPLGTAGAGSVGSGVMGSAG